MSNPPSRGVAGVEHIAEFDTLIDARSPTEYADDHLPGAINLPVLSDAQRAEIGTLYKQVSPFAAKKLGAAYVSRNIAQHLETALIDKPKHWRPLVYCWRGGQRSGAFTHILHEVGWPAHRLQGGYKAWRRHVIAELEQLPPRLHFKVITGATGSGKSRLLERLAVHGAQVLHLESLAAHKGSVLGSLPTQLQPSQKHFESCLYAALKAFSPERPVYVEAESRRIGVLQIPDTLIESMRGSPCLRLEVSRESRIEFLLRDYDYAIADPAWLIERIGHLHNLQSRETIDLWHELIARRDFPILVEELLAKHYDPLYQRSQRGNFDALDGAETIQADDLSEVELDHLASTILAQAT